MNRRFTIGDREIAADWRIADCRFGAGDIESTDRQFDSRQQSPDLQSAIENS